jgi:hypothetical protein
MRVEGAHSNQIKGKTRSYNLFRITLLEKACLSASDLAARVAHSLRNLLKRGTRVATSVPQVGELNTHPWTDVTGKLPL